MTSLRNFDSHSTWAQGTLPVGSRGLGTWGATTLAPSISLASTLAPLEWVQEHPCQLVEEVGIPQGVEEGPDTTTMHPPPSPIKCDRYIEREPRMSWIDSMYTGHMPEPATWHHGHPGINDGLLPV